MLSHILRCPSCGNEILEAVSDGEDTNFLCQQCWTCWHWDLGYLTRITVSTCPGCAHRDECRRRAGIS